MKLQVLVENTKKNTELKVKAKHGLSLYIETNNKKILLDVGINSLFLKNAKNMNVDISEVDILIISHGHIDHGGGLNSFLKVNQRAKIYMHKNVNKNYYTKIFKILPIYIGLNRTVLDANFDRITYINDSIEISEGIFLETNFSTKFPRPDSNNSLFSKENNKLKQDDFSHEIVLISKEQSGLLVFSSCSHSGIANILFDCEARYSESIRAVIGGFHLYNPINKRNEEFSYIDNLGAALKRFNTEYYTCHCTGEHNIELLSKRLHNTIHTINVGDKIEI